MHPSGNAFDRVKSLLGKMDRSIDDARRRRLTDPADASEPADSPHDENQSETNQVAAKAPETAARPEPSRPEAPPRANSKYGRARPIRDLSGPAQASWQRA